MKNCGHRFHVQVANRDFIDGVLVKIISPKANPPTIVQDKVLSLIQVLEHSLYLLFLMIKFFCYIFSFFCLYQHTPLQNFKSGGHNMCLFTCVAQQFQPFVILSGYLRSPQPTDGVLHFSFCAPLNINRNVLKEVVWIAFLKRYLANLKKKERNSLSIGAK